MLVKFLFFDFFKNKIRKRINNGTLNLKRQVVNDLPENIYSFTFIVASVVFGEICEFQVGVSFGRSCVIFTSLGNLDERLVTFLILCNF